MDVNIVQELSEEVAELKQALSEASYLLEKSHLSRDVLLNKAWLTRLLSEDNSRRSTSLLPRRAVGSADLFEVLDESGFDFNPRKSTAT